MGQQEEEQIFLAELPQVSAQTSHATDIQRFVRPYFSYLLYWIEVAPYLTFCSFPFAPFRRRHRLRGQWDHHERWRANPTDDDGEREDDHRWRSSSSGRKLHWLPASSVASSSPHPHSTSSLRTGDWSPPLYPSPLPHPLLLHIPTIALVY